MLMYNTRESEKKKQEHPVVAHNFAKCWPILKILSPADSAVKANEMIIKDPTTTQTYHYTTLWSASIRKTSDPLKEMSCLTIIFT